MAAYASSTRESLTRIRPEQPAQLGLVAATALGRHLEPPQLKANEQADMTAVLISQVIDRLAERIALVLVDLLGADERDSSEWLDCRHAAEYLGVHRDTLRKLAAERTIPSEQDGPGCKLYFRRSGLDAWRPGGGRPRHLAP
jgi:excisionase family DNA binding protein